MSLFGTGEDIRKSRLTDEQVVKILARRTRPRWRRPPRSTESQQTIYNWRRPFTGMDVAEAKRLRALESENGRFKTLLAERNLEIEVMKEIAGKKMADASHAAIR